MADTTIVATRGHIELLHIALRRERVAAAAVNYWSAQYKDNPTDLNAISMHGAWCELRAAVDELVDIRRLDEQVDLAT